MAMQKRFFEYGFPVGFWKPGKRNAITDVAGVRVGHATLVEGDDVRTGITLVDPGTPNLFRQKLPAAVAVGNGFGKMAGTTQLEELGTLETPIALTNTLAVGPVMRAVADIVIRETNGIESHETVNAVVGETNDGHLNAIHQNRIGAAEVEAAYAALSEEVAVGNVGAGTGTRAFSWKGGIGTASRVVPIDKTSYTLGVLVQTNFGGSLCIQGVPVGQMLKKTDFDDFKREVSDGSCMIVVATDAPLTSRQLKRIAKRSLFGMVRTGSVMAHGSGDYAVAFSTSRAGVEGSGDVGTCLPDTALTPLFLAAVDATEEAIYDALFAAETITGCGTTLEALPKDEVLDFLAKTKQ